MTAQNPPLGLYLHIPFCRQKCPYCDFYSLAAQEEAMDSYTAAQCRAMDTCPHKGRAVDTIYFGGGTPPLMGEQRLAALLEQTARGFAVDPDAEITLEANPGTVDAQSLISLRGAGFNRISFGVQSAVDRELAALGRIHTARQAAEAIQTAAQAGFTNISADLMLGIPGQTRESLEQSIAFLTALPLRHISAYLLKIEEGTPFADNAIAATLPDEDLTAQLYTDCIDLLAAAGFPQYEISNFAHEGFASRHNLKYWRCGEYLGLGPSAHSFVEGRRFFFPRNINSFINAQDPWTLAQDDGPGGDAQEQLMLALRLTEGINLSRLQLDTNPLFKAAASLEQHGLLKIEGTHIALTKEGFLLSNSVISNLLQAL